MVVCGCPGHKYLITGGGQGRSPGLSQDWPCDGSYDMINISSVMSHYPPLRGVKNRLKTVDISNPLNGGGNG